MKNIITNIKIENSNTQKLVKKGILFSFLLTIISTFILLIYHLFYANPITFYIGISLFKSSLFFLCFFIIFGIAFDTINKGY